MDYSEFIRNYTMTFKNHISQGIVLMEFRHISTLYLFTVIFILHTNLLSIFLRTDYSLNCTLQLQPDDKY